MQRATETSAAYEFAGVDVGTKFCEGQRSTSRPKQARRTMWLIDAVSSGSKGKWVNERGDAEGYDEASRQIGRAHV